MVKCQDVSEAITCDEFEVTEAADTSFDGVYEVSPLDVLGASEDEPVYEKKNGGGKFLFRKDGVWNLGSNNNTGAINYSGELPASRGASKTWGVTGGSRVTVINRNAVCSEDFDRDEDSEYLGDLSTMTNGRNGCRGALAIIHVPETDPDNSGYMRTFRATNYWNLRRAFRRRRVQSVEVWGTCSWRLFPRRRFRGAPVYLNPGFNGHVNFRPYSIAQL